MSPRTADEMHPVRFARRCIALRFCTLRFLRLQNRQPRPRAANRFAARGKAGFDIFFELFGRFDFD